MTTKEQKLLEEARKVSKNAYTPYSNFKVGAAILLKNGTIITGANVENCAYGPTNCAERSAMFYAFSQGYRKEDIEMMAVITDTETPASPCGVCRQVMSELLTPECPLILGTLSNDEIMISDIKTLLPYSFTL